MKIGEIDTPDKAVPQFFSTPPTHMPNCNEVLFPQAKFHGTPVTKKAFLEWRERFDKEMSEATKQIKVSSSLGSKLTGRFNFRLISFMLLLQGV